MAGTFASAAVGLVLIAAQPVQPAAPPPAAGDPWVLGYAVQVSRTCSAWKLEAQETLAARGILPRQGQPERLLPLNSQFETLFYEGQAAAKADRNRHAAFCSNVDKIVGRQWQRLARALRPVSADHR